MSSAFVAPRGVRPQQSALFWLAIRLSVNVRGAAAVRLVRLAAGTALAAVPLMVWLAAGLSGAGSDGLSASTVVDLALAACPGVVLSLWAARSLSGDRAAVAEALRQVGAERAAAWLLPALRISLAAGLGALGGAVAVAVLRSTLFHDLPKRAPLRAAVAAISAGDWVAAAAGVTALLIVGALFASGAGHRLAHRFKSRVRPTAEAGVK
jgi:hypothetical protein